MESDRGRRSMLLPILLAYILYASGVSIAIITILGLWYFGLVALEERGSLDRIDAARVLGIILMLRTSRGKGFLDSISKNRKFWRMYGEFSIWLCLLVMIGVILLIFTSAIATAINPPEEYLPASDLLLIPGLTSFVPFWWPALALIVALVIHEYSHGIQARAHGMRLRSFGLLLVGPIPIGAFAEPEEEEMSRATRRDRMRLFAAGPSINILVTYIVLILLSTISSGMVASDEGVHARRIIEGEAADSADLLPYETIIEIDGVGVPDYSSFSSKMELLSAGDEVLLVVLSAPNLDEGRLERVVPVTMGDKYHYYIGLCDGDESCIGETEDLLKRNEILPGEAFLGVSGLVSGSAGIDGFSNIVNGEYSIGESALIAFVSPLVMLQTPISLEGQTMILEEREMLVAGDGMISSLLGIDLMLMLFDFFFWLVWINFLLGFANLIPMIPFDGGHIVRDGVHSTIRRFLTGMHPMKVEQIANRISSMSSIFILFILAIPVVLPRLL